MSWVNAVKQQHAEERRQAGVEVSPPDAEMIALYTLGRIRGLSAFAQLVEHMRSHLIEAALDNKMAGHYEAASPAIIAERIIPPVIAEMLRQADILAESMATNDGRMNELSPEEIARHKQQILKDDLSKFTPYLENKAFGLGYAHTLEWPLRGLNFNMQMHVLMNDLTGDVSADAVARVIAFRTVVDYVGLLMNPQNDPIKVLNGNIEGMEISKTAEALLDAMTMAQAKIDKLLFSQPPAPGS